MHESWSEGGMTEHERDLKNEEDTDYLKKNAN